MTTFDAAITLPVSIEVASRKVASRFQLDALPPHIIAELAMHGLTQKLADSCATLRPKENETETDCIRRQMADVYDALRAGNWKRRRTGNATDPLLPILRGLLRENMSDAQRKEYKKLNTGDERNEFLDAILDGMDDEIADRYREFAQEEYDRLEAEKAERAAKLAKLKLKL